VSDLKYLQASDTDIPTQPVAIMLNKDNSNLQTKINNALKSLRKDGTLTKLSKKYFAADITKK
ncbi:transporter substrate-binding domain-containing protein, partial [Lactobacillus jensenii]